MKVVFQSPIFRGKLLVSGRVTHSKTIDTNCLRYLQNHPSTKATARCRIAAASCRPIPELSSLKAWPSKSPKNLLDSVAMNVIFGWFFGLSKSKQGGILTDSILSPCRSKKKTYGMNTARKLSTNLEKEVSSLESKFLWSFFKSQHGRTRWKPKKKTEILTHTPLVTSDCWISCSYLSFSWRKINFCKLNVDLGSNCSGVLLRRCQCIEWFMSYDTNRYRIQQQIGSWPRFQGLNLPWIDCNHYNLSCTSEEKFCLVLFLFICYESPCDEFVESKCGEFFPAEKPLLGESNSFNRPDSSSMTFHQGSPVVAVWVCIYREL